MDKLLVPDWKDIHFFRPFEFDSPDAPGSGVKMNVAFITQLDELRRRCGFPLVIRSGFRTDAHNALVGGVDSSAHMLGLAADIRAGSSDVRFTIVLQALMLNFMRVGIGAGFVHLDVDITKDQGVIWLY